MKKILFLLFFITSIDAMAQVDANLSINHPKQISSDDNYLQARLYYNFELGYIYYSSMRYLVDAGVSFSSIVFDEVENKIINSRLVEMKNSHEIHYLGVYSSIDYFLSSRFYLTTTVAFMSDRNMNVALPIDTSIGYSLDSIKSFYLELGLKSFEISNKHNSNGVSLSSIYFKIGMNIW